MKIKSLLTILLITFSALFFSCKKNNVAPDFTNTIVLPANGADIINANNDFAFQFLNVTLAQDQAPNNKLISPMSIYLALSMVYNGADNATKDSITNVLQLAGIDVQSLNAVCQALINQLPKEDNKVQLSIANSIWYRQNSYQPFAAFLDTIQKSYNASIQSLNFNSPSAVNTINNWVALNTNNKIPTIIENISPDDLMFLINAIYFNGAWKNRFNTSDTYNAPFYLPNGNTETVPFMKQTITTKMVTNSSFTMLELPYGSGNSFSMYLMQPNSNQQSLFSFANTLNKNVLSTAIDQMDSNQVELHLPKWSYSYSIDDMRPELSMMGMGIAFTSDADFSKIYNPSQVQVYISKAIHKTFIKVNEEGTQAAAATAIGIVMTTSPAPPPVINFDHPFMYAIIEKQTGAILFFGMVNDPLSSGS